jgi:hypothetical protein
MDVDPALTQRGCPRQIKTDAHAPEPPKTSEFSIRDYLLSHASRYELLQGWPRVHMVLID